MTNKNFYILLFLVLVGAILRFYNLNWDDGHFFHPDERNIAVAVDKIRFFSQLNPQFFAYNGFWIYLVRFVGEFFAYANNSSTWLTQWGNVNLASRFLSAFFSTLSILFIYKIAKKLMNPTAGLLAAALSVFTVGFIQYAHYGVTESILVFWMLLLTNLSLHKRWFASAIVAGLAVGTKTSALPFLLIPALTWLFTDRRIKAIPYAILAFLISVFISTPYSFLSWEKFYESMRYEGGVVSGLLKVPYTLQFQNTAPYLFQFQNLFWHLGPVLPILGIIGLIWWLYLSFAKRNYQALGFLVFAVVYSTYVGSWYTKFIRYLLPIYPVLIISTVWLIFQLKEHKKLSRLLTMWALVTTTTWSLTYFSVFIKPSTRIAASHWIYQNIPANSKILTEHWDDRVPIGLKGYSTPYNFIEMENYLPDSYSKLAILSGNLSQGDYVILSSRRLSGSIGKAKIQYPYTSKYYQLLVEEKLGYKLLKRFDSYPQLSTLIINDDESEETFQVYDHPVVYVFQNQERFTSEQIQGLLNKTP